MFVSNHKPPPPPPYHILIVAGTAVMRAGLRSLLTNVPDIRVTGEVWDRETLQVQLSQQKPRVVLVCLDPDLEMTGIEAIHMIKTLRPASKVLLLSTDQDPDTIAACIAGGADGYLPHGLEREVLAEAIRDVVRYGLVLAEDVAPVVRERLATEGSGLLTALTAREQEVLRQVARGRTNQEIAQTLSISYSTVRTHLNNIYRKLGIESRPALIAFALRAGLRPANDVDDEAEETDL